MTLGHLISRNVQQTICRNKRLLLNIAMRRAHNEEIEEEKYIYGNMKELLGKNCEVGILRKFSKDI